MIWRKLFGMREGWNKKNNYFLAASKKSFFSKILVWSGYLYDLALKQASYCTTIYQLWMLIVEFIDCTVTNRPDYCQYFEHKNLSF